MKKHTLLYEQALQSLGDLANQKSGISEAEEKQLHSMIDKLREWEIEEEREELFLKYMRELGTYTDNFKEASLSDEEVIQMARDLFPDGKLGGCTTWIDIMKDDEIVGFLIMSSAPACHPQTDYLLNQTYVLPEYRKQGLMSCALRAFMKEHPRSRYSIVILKKNKWASHFWRTFYDSIGYSMMPLSAAEGIREDEMWVGYEPNPEYFK